MNKKFSVIYKNLHITLHCNEKVHSPILIKSTASLIAALSLSDPPLSTSMRPSAAATSGTGPRKPEVEKIC